ncbi:Trem-like transcript 4 protein [Manis javanica]|nr:Trem-like transcript 4 protein [Manis javanica]
MEPRASAWAQQPRESAPASPVPGSDSASSAVKAGEYGQDFSSGGGGGPPAWSDGNKHLGVVASLLLALDQGSPGGENKHHSQESDTVSTLDEGTWNQEDLLELLTCGACLHCELHGWGGCTESLSTGSLFSGASLLPPQLQKRLMAWEATYLLPPILLVLLASGSWEQNPELNKLEGETVSVRCPYKPQQDLNKVKIWCRQTSAYTCTMLAAHPRLKAELWETRYSIQDDLRSGYFTVTMADLRVKDTGFYWCGIYESPGIFILRTIHLVVSQASTLPTPRSTRRTTTWTSTTSPAIDSPPNNRNLVVFSATVAVSLLLVLTFLIVLCLWKGRGRARKGEDEFHHTCDISAHEETAAHRKDTSLARNESQLSWGSDQQMGSGKDPGAICYASLAPLKYFGPEDSIYHCWKQTPALQVGRPRSRAQDLRAEFTGRAVKS